MNGGDQGRLARLLATADRVDDRLATHRGEPAGWDRASSSGPVAGAWAVAKLGALAAVAPALGAVVGVAAARNAREMLRLTVRYPEVVDKVLAGHRTGEGWDRIGRIPAGERWFVSSDLHRYVRGTFDWPGGQDTKALYVAVLDHYADHDHGLIEAGDVEDFWLVGGSTYGVAYDAVRMGAALLRRPHRIALRRRLYREHLRRVVANNEAIYDTIQRRFHGAGRYRRLVGNHDDCLADPAVLAALREVHPGVTADDFLVLDGSDAAVGVITHGHHTDSWNGPGRSGLGRFGTSLASAIADLPLVHKELGVPKPAATQALLQGEHRSLLVFVSQFFGANLEAYSVDEALLFAAFQQHHDRTGSDLDDGPFVLMGHSHLPLSWPLDPRSGKAWRRYLNTGSGVGHGLITGVEWDGTGGGDGTVGGSEPDVRLVAWHWADDDTPAQAVVGTAGGRPFARRTIERVPPAITLSIDHVATGAAP